MNTASTTSSDSARDVREAVRAVLADLGRLVDAVGDERYRREGVTGFASSLGAHARHCLDHVESVLASAADDVVRYDVRERGTPVERDRTLALERIESARTRVASLTDASLEAPVVTWAMVAPESGEQPFASTRRRELLYAFHHTVHHLALMRAHAAHMGVDAEDHAGLAPATIAASRSDRDDRD